MTNERYIIIGRSTCSFCRMAADICVAKNIDYIFLDYAENLEILEEYKVFHSQETVPIVLSNNCETGNTRKIGGYSELLEHLGC